MDSIAENRHILQERSDYSEKLDEAFEDLVTIAQAEEAEAGSIDTLMESGLFVSARSSFHSELADAVFELNSAAISPTDGIFDGKLDILEEMSRNLSEWKDCQQEANMRSRETEHETEE